MLLYIFWFLHQTTTDVFSIIIILGCISFDSYIKPQPRSWKECCSNVVYLLIPTSNHNLRLGWVGKRFVVYLLIPTSNHNFCSRIEPRWLLYIFWFLHQTTTNTWFCFLSKTLYIFWFLHQTTTASAFIKNFLCCISFDSYIKPQLYLIVVVIILVVYLLIPTSNHNCKCSYTWDDQVVYLLIPTSNHNSSTL